MAGKLRVYLGAAPGVGKTFRMLDEGHRRQARGTDVVVAYVETHGRRRTEALVDGLEVVPRLTRHHRGVAFEELDVDAVLARRPEVALVDELAHTDVPGGRHEKRWQDVQELLAAGIDVISTVNVQHLESLNDVVEEITGVPQRETVPDSVVRAAEQIELVDMTPEALRRRMAHGNIYPPEKVDAALGNYFRTGNLTALRELALLWLADKVDDQLDAYRAEHRIGQKWEARERVVVALTGGPEGDTLVRRASRIADRTKGSDLHAVHVTRSDGLRAGELGGEAVNLARQRNLVENLGGTYHQVVGTDIPSALLDFARGVNATQLVLGASRRGRLAQLFSPGVGVNTTAESGAIDVHMVTHENVRARRRPTRPGGGLSSRRRAAGFVVAALGLPLLTAALLPLHEHLALSTDILAFLMLVVAVALVGGLLPALLSAVLGFGLLNWFFTPPVHRFTISEAENLFALAGFVLVAAAVSAVVDLAARRTREAARARAEAATLFTLAGSVLGGDQPLTALLAQLRESFGLDSVSLLERGENGWQLVECVGGTPCATPSEGDAEVRATDDVTLAVRGGPLAAADRRVLEAFGAQAALALQQQRLSAEAARATTMTEVDKLRTALLNAVGHDLRTPLASATAAVSSLRSTDIEFSPDDRAELLATAEESLDRLRALVENLLDLSRLQAGALAMTPQPLDVAEAVGTAVAELGAAARPVTIAVPADLDDVSADPGLLQRALVNVLANALRYSAPGRPPLVTASGLGGTVEIRVVDHGPGVPEPDRERIFQPFQRLGDRDNTTGVGLGLALSRGLLEAMGGSLEPETTPGGGLTMVLRLSGVPAPATPDERIEEARP
ncbi:DUF4118 domain-containing protein [Spongisporangium articulatum]|uniref:histidine kinase n=1 Tax=Spongisporangium articulatum TaxID=3362603 RepID=A0ABW8AQM2_9ACTN